MLDQFVCVQSLAVSQALREFLFVLVRTHDGKLQLGIDAHILHIVLWMFAPFIGSLHMFTVDAAYWDPGTSSVFIFYTHINHFRIVRMFVDRKKYSGQTFMKFTEAGRSEFG